MIYSKTLLKALEDSEQSSAVGSAVVLKNFIRLKGSELFHAIPELVKDSLTVSDTNRIIKSKYIIKTKPSISRLSLIAIHLVQKQVF